MSARTAGKWVRRYGEEGVAGLLDRRSAPRHVHNVTSPERMEVIAALRRVRMTGPEIAEILGMATSTVSAVLNRIGLGRLRDKWPGPATCPTSTPGPGALPRPGHVDDGRPRRHHWTFATLTG